jgi:hypothetical protein
MEFHPLSELEKKLDPEVITKARKLYEQDSLNLKLKAIREKYDVKQGDAVSSTQTAVSKLGNRKDIRISALIDYLQSFDMGLEIVALPKGNNTEREVLLKV